MTVVKANAQFTIQHNVEAILFKKEVVYSPEFWGYAKLWHSSPLAYYAKCILESGFLERRSVRNKIVDDGLLQINKLLLGSSTDSITFTGVGSGTNAVDAGDHELQTAIGSRHAIGYRYAEGNTKSHFDSWYGDQENNGTWNEAAIYSGDQAYPTDYMIARLLVNQPGGFAKDDTKTAILAWTITLASVN